MAHCIIKKIRTVTKVIYVIIFVTLSCAYLSSISSKTMVENAINVLIKNINLSYNKKEQNNNPTKIIRKYGNILLFELVTKNLTQFKIRK